MSWGYAELSEMGTWVPHPASAQKTFFFSFILLFYLIFYYHLRIILRPPLHS